MGVAQQCASPALGYVAAMLSRLHHRPRIACTSAAPYLPVHQACYPASRWLSPATHHPPPAGLIGWVVIDLAMAHKQWTQGGAVSPGMLLVCAFQVSNCLRLPCRCAAQSPAAMVQTFCYSTDVSAPTHPRATSRTPTFPATRHPPLPSCPGAVRAGRAVV